MDQRVQFIADYQRDVFDVAELARRYGISRKTAYKWIDRYDAAGPAGLVDRSRRPAHSPQETPEMIVVALLEVRRRHPTWGAKKLLKIVATRQPTWTLPARSTVCEFLDRAGLITTSRRRPVPRHPGRPLLPMTAPNGTWTADFKGQFKTGNGAYCYPLTIADGFSRFVLKCEANVQVNHCYTQPGFQRAFEEYGLPKAIRTDNGPPFANRGLGISRLSVWWMKLGIRHERIEPGHPEQNGCHERMHRTLKADTTKPPAKTLRGQQQRFDRWRREFNEERPHEALDLRPPADLYGVSGRRYPAKVPEVTYPSGFTVRQVRQNGAIKWHSQLIYTSISLVHEPVGLELIDDGRWRVYFTQEPIGILDEHLKKVLPM
jgi:transposase InsO family protein